MTLAIIGFIGCIGSIPAPILVVEIPSVCTPILSRVFSKVGRNPKIPMEPVIVSRLDKETSGVMIVAKNREYAQLFTSLFRIRKIHKTYLAITHGAVKKGINLLQDNLTTYEKNKKVIQKAISHLKILKSNNEHSFLELKPITGRKHQLRKQLYNIGNPVVGDDKYSFGGASNKFKVKNIMLHAYKIKFMINNIKYNFEAKYGDEFEQFIKRKF